MWYASWCGRLFIFQTIIYMVVRYVFFVILLHYACTESKTANRVSCNTREWFWQGGREAIKIFVILSRGSHTAHNCHHIVDHVSLHLFPDISSRHWAILLRVLAEQVPVLYLGSIRWSLCELFVCFSTKTFVGKKTPLFSWGRKQKSFCCDEEEEEEASSCLAAVSFRLCGSYF